MLRKKTTEQSVMQLMDQLTKWVMGKMIGLRIDWPIG
jgi:hypothetical protein